MNTQAAKARPPKLRCAQLQLTVGLAAVAATVLLLLGGAGYRAVVNRYARPADSAPLPAGTLAKLPLAIGGWSGKDDPLAAAVIEQTDTDDHLSRIYINRAASQSVSLWVGYGVQLRDLTPHRPEVCYPGNGWIADGAATVELSLEDGGTLACRILRFRKGGLSTERVTVLNYYIIDGEFFADVSALRSRASQSLGEASYVVQVQLSSNGGPFRRDPESTLREFAVLSTPELGKLLPAKGLEG